MPHSPLLDAGDSLLLVIDIQGTLVKRVQDADRVLAAQVRMIEVAKTLGVPIVVTEHYPKGLGPTDDRVKKALGEHDQPLEKVVFSCFGAEGFLEALRETGRNTVVVIGIETHICVLQTALEAAAHGFDVHIVTDAVSARGRLDHDTALRKMDGYRIEQTTWESATYQWLRRADTPEFKAILKLVKE